MAAIAALGLIAALLSRGDSDDPVVTGGGDCASCTSKDDGSCKIACLMDQKGSGRRDPSAGRLDPSAGRQATKNGA